MNPSDAAQALPHRLRRLPADRSPCAGPQIAVVAAGVASTLFDRFRDRPTGPLRSATPLALVIVSPPLNSPDRFAVVLAERRGPEIAIALDRRTYTGPLVGNESEVAWIEIELGRLAAGDYRVDCQETTAEFAHLDQPDETQAPASRASELRFAVD